MAVIETEGSGTKWFAIMVIGVMICLSGCLYGAHYQEGQTNREKEKTKQLEIQWKIDSTNAKNHEVKG